MGLQLYQVDGKSYLLDFKNLHTSEHPDAMRVKKMTRAASEANGSSDALDIIFFMVEDCFRTGYFINIYLLRSMM